jgi:hypothetical protein
VTEGYNVKTLALIVVTASLGFATQLAGQNGSPANCHGMLTATLASGRPHGDLAGCAKHAIPEYVQHVRGARTERDPRRLADLAMYASYVRDPAVLSAAWELVGDRSAPAAARNLGLVLALAQHQHGLAPSEVHSYFRLLTEPVDGVCYLSVGTGSRYWVSNALPPDELDQTVSRARDVLADPAAAETTRRLAACIVRNLASQVGRGPDLSQVNVSYLCGHDYVVHNGTASYLTLDWTIDDSDESGGLTIAPHSDQRVFVETPGTLRLTYQDRVIATAAAHIRACNTPSM